MKIGQGYDVHPLKEGRSLILGGVTIPHTHGLDGHSDADVLTHAICDALLGAMGAGDLGTRYPSSDPAYKDLSSMVMLKNVVESMRDKGCRLNNLDTVILAQAPKLSPYLPEIRERVARELLVELDRVNVKVKSGEGIGMIGRAEGIAALAICLLTE